MTCKVDFRTEGLGPAIFSKDCFPGKEAFKFSVEDTEMNDDQVTPRRKKMILVTGATGTVGSELLTLLSNEKVPVRALVHRRSLMPSETTSRIECVEGDFEQPETLKKAMMGVEKLYLLSPMRPDLGKLETRVIQLAQASGVRHVVKQSVLGAPSESFSLARWHRESERALEKSGMAWTHLRPVFFMSNLLSFGPSIRKDGVFQAPTGDASLSLIHPRDIAHVARAVLTQAGHEGKSYILSGSRLWNFPEVAQLFSLMLGRSVRFFNITHSQYLQAMNQLGAPKWAAEALLELYLQVKAGAGGPVTQVVENLTGRPPLTLENWVQENLSFFR